MVKNGVLWRNDYFIFCEEEREAERESEGLALKLWFRRKCAVNILFWRYWQRLQVCNKS